jgi:hypothetical protein
MGRFFSGRSGSYGGYGGGGGGGGGWKYSNSSSGKTTTTYKQQPKPVYNAAHYLEVRTLIDVYVVKRMQC